MQDVGLDFDEGLIHRDMFVGLQIGRALGQDAVLISLRQPVGSAEHLRIGGNSE